MKRAIGYSALGILLMALVFGCSFGMTIEQRIQQFEDDLNLVIRTGIIHLNFHSQQTVDFPAIRDTDFFGIDFPSPNLGDPTDRYVITVLDSSNPAQVTATIGNTALWGAGVFKNARFSMAYEGLDYKIVTLQVDFGLGWEDVVQ
jgi:hypothetical protein